MQERGRRQRQYSHTWRENVFVKSQHQMEIPGKLRTYSTVKSAPKETTWTLKSGLSEGRTRRHRPGPSAASLPLTSCTRMSAGGCWTI